MWDTLFERKGGRDGLRKERKKRKKNNSIFEKYFLCVVHIKCSVAYFLYVKSIPYNGKMNKAVTLRGEVMPVLSGPIKVQASYWLCSR